VDSVQAVLGKGLLCSYKRPEGCKGIIQGKGMGRKVKADGEKKVGQDMQTNCVTDV
jgi:hypothetical protein